MSGYRRFDPEGRPIFVTFATHGRDPWLRDAHCAQVLLDAIRRVNAMHAFRHLAHVVMSDHVHWMFVPISSKRFSDIVGAVKRDVTWRMRERGDRRASFWQQRFFDHIVRDERDFGRHLDYIHFNPVKHGVATRAADHPYSSFREWVKRGVYDEDWGVAEPGSIAGLELE